MHPRLSDFRSRIAFCACYALNVWNGQSFPFLSQTLFNEDGSQYDQLLILDDNFKLDPAKLAKQVEIVPNVQKIHTDHPLLGSPLVCELSGLDENRR